MAASSTTTCSGCYDDSCADCKEYLDSLGTSCSGCDDATCVFCAIRKSDAAMKKLQPPKRLSPTRPSILKKKKSPERASWSLVTKLPRKLRCGCDPCQKHSFYADDFAKCDNTGCNAAEQLVLTCLFCDYSYHASCIPTGTIGEFFPNDKIECHCRRVIFDPMNSARVADIMKSKRNEGLFELFVAQKKIRCLATCCATGDLLSSIKCTRCSSEFHVHCVEHAKCNWR